MEERAEIGDVIQIDPEHDEMFGGCFGIVEAVKDWGCNLVAFTIPGKDGAAYYRVAHGKYRIIGQAKWTLQRVVRTLDVEVEGL